MKILVTSALSCLVLLSACATQENACEDITLATEQIQACQSLQRQIVNAKERPLIRTELERRYQTDCIDIRYYRQGHQEAICGNKENIEKANQAVIEEQKQ